MPYFYVLTHACPIAKRDRTAHYTGKNPNEPSQFSSVVSRLAGLKSDKPIDTHSGDGGGRTPCLLVALLYLRFGIYSGRISLLLLISTSAQVCAQTTCKRTLPITITE